jgi:hypothetical protein
VIGPDDKDKESSSVEGYRRYVAEVANAADRRVIINRNPNHAGVIIEQLFRKAELEIDILTGGLYVPTYGLDPVINSATDFLRNHQAARINILSEAPIDPKHPLLGSLRGANLFHRVRLAVIEPRVKERHPYHFALADGRHFRLQTAPGSLGAVVQFGEEKIGGQLRAIFAELQQDSLPHL